MGDHASHKQRTLSGIVWNFFRVFGQTVFGLGTGIVLARLLQPEDFGLLAVAMVFIGVADLVASVGMEPAVVQRKELSEKTLARCNNTFVDQRVCADARFLGAGASYQRVLQ